MENFYIFLSIILSKNEYQYFNKTDWKIIWKSFSFILKKKKVEIFSGC